MSLGIGERKGEGLLRSFVQNDISLRLVRNWLWARKKYREGEEAKSRLTKY